jgi:hypothetical protein
MIVILPENFFTLLIVEKVKTTKKINIFFILLSFSLNTILRLNRKNPLKKKRKKCKTLRDKNMLKNVLKYEYQVILIIVIN